MNKLCDCGCGKEVINEKNRFIFNHHRIGSKVAPESKLKQQETRNKKSKDDLIKIKEKYKQTCIQKYGVDNAFKSAEIKEKIIQTNMNKFGVDNPGKSEEIKQKIRSVMLERYGETTNLKCQETKDKIKQTNLKLRGVEHIMQSNEIQEKSKQTWKKHTQLQKKEILDKWKQSCLNRLGVEYPSQSKEIQEKKKHTCLIHFGVDNYAKTAQARQLYRENCIRRIESQSKNNEPLMPCVGFLERQCFDILKTLTQYGITKEKIIGYFPDGYIKELNLIIEFYEDWHNHGRNLKHDLIRQKDLEDFLHCKFFIIHEKEWQNNKDQVISTFKNLITQLSEQK